nr:ATPase [Maliibacterium massiliense]
MNVLSLLDLLQSELEQASNMPFSGGKAVVDREKCLDIIDEIRATLPDDLRNAEFIKRERQRIIMEAEREAETRLNEAEDQVKTMVDEHEITQQATAKAHEIVSMAQDNAKEIRMAANQYTDDVLSELEEYIAGHLDMVHENRQSLKNGGGRQQHE